MPGERTVLTGQDGHPGGQDGDGGFVATLLSMLRGLGLTLGITLSATVSGWLLGKAAVGVSGNRMAPWIIGRAAGITSYLLMVALVAMGLVLSHPWRARFRVPSTATRIRLHVSLAMFTLVFTAMHIVVLATDTYAGVGWRGALLPLGASYRPIPVTLGVIGLWAGLLAGLTATFSGRLAARVWWPIHKIAALALVLVWVHGLLAGSDSATLRWLYLSTGAGLVALAVSRYVTRTPADRVADLLASHPKPTGTRHVPMVQALPAAARPDLDGRGR